MSSWWRIISLVSALPKGKERKDDDFTDRLSNRYTVLVLVVFTVVVSMHHYIGKPITCWSPKHITKGQSRYVNNYCWVRNTYYLPYEEEVPGALEDSPLKQTVTYYQWIPFILLTMAIFFYLPTVVWNGLNEKSGVDADNILGTALTFEKRKGADIKEKHLMFITRQIHRFLTSGAPTQPSCSLSLKQLLLRVMSRFCGITGGSYLTVLYITVKILYLANVIAQLFVLNLVLGIQFNEYGLDMAKHLIEGTEWNEHETIYFPRVTMCDFSVRRLGNLHSYTVQCVLPINLYNERIFFFLWYWMVFVAAATGVSLFKWVVRAIFPSDQYRYIKRHLSDSNRITGDHSLKLVRKFTSQYLRRDGVFLLRLIGHNTNGITVTEITTALWDRWTDDQGYKLDDIHHSEPSSMATLPKQSFARLNGPRGENV